MITINKSILKAALSDVLKSAGRVSPFLSWNAFCSR